MAQQKKIEMFLPAEQDPRSNGTSLGDERATYAEYQKKTEREIPVFKLTPVD